MKMAEVFPRHFRANRYRLILIGNAQRRALGDCAIFAGAEVDAIGTGGADAQAIIADRTVQPALHQGDACRIERDRVQPVGTRDKAADLAPLIARDIGIGPGGCAFGPCCISSIQPVGAGARVESL